MTQLRITLHNKEGERGQKEKRKKRGKEYEVIKGEDISFAIGPN